MSNTTKRALEDSLKKLLLSKPLDKITVHLRHTQLERLNPLVREPLNHLHQDKALEIIRDYHLISHLAKA